MNGDLGELNMTVFQILVRNHIWEKTSIQQITSRIWEKIIENPPLMQLIKKIILQNE